MGDTAATDSSLAVKFVKISDIIIGDRDRKVFDDIPELADSILTNGQIQPILLDSNMKLIAGERRIRAVKHIGRDMISAIIMPIDQISSRKTMERDENIERKEFTVSEKVDIAIAIEKEIKLQGERRGKKRKSVDSEQDAKVDNHPCNGEKTRDFVARRAGFRSEYSYRQAREVTEKAIPEVVQAMDRNDISINAAFDIAQQPKKRQLTALDGSVTRLDVNGTELTKSQGERRKAKRKEKHRIPATHTPAPIFNIIRVSPNWGDELVCDILDTPVADYASAKGCLVAVEADSLHLDRAFECIDKWGFSYFGIYTIWDPKHVGEVPALCSTYGAHFIVLGHYAAPTDEVNPYRVSINKQLPVIVRHDIGERAILGVLDLLFLNSDDKKIDMSSTSKRKGWICWKSSYGISNEPEPDAATKPDVGREPDTEQPAAETDYDTKNQVDLFRGLPDTIDSDEATFEPGTGSVPRRDLKIFTE